MLHPLIGSIDIDLTGPESAFERLVPTLPRWTPRAHLRPRHQIDVRIDYGVPFSPGELLFEQPLVEISRDIRRRLLVTAPKVGAMIGEKEIELFYEPSASPRCVQAVFDTLWPLTLPRHGLFHVHGAAVRDEEGRGWLLAGDANIGKSTSTLALVSAGWHFAADDAVYVTHAPGFGVMGHGWAEPIRLTARSAMALGVERDVPQSEMKSNAILDVSLAARRVDSMGLHRVCFPEFGAETALRPICAREALERLLAASAWIVCVPVLAKAYLATLAAVASLPASVVVLGPELLEQPDLLAEHLSCAAAAAA